jgi:predicted phosphoribosyltransferase
MRFFRDRAEAAHLLAEALTQYRGRNPLVLAIPRGAVPMGRIVAQALNGDLDVVLVRKLRAPGNPEFAVGAVAESGWTYVADDATATGTMHDYLERERTYQLTVIRHRRVLYTPGHPAIASENRTVIVIDDGLATGSTMIAALHAVRARNPATLVCAVPVASPEALARVKGGADRTVCLVSSGELSAISQFYDAFPQVTDDEVIAILSTAKQSNPPVAARARQW